MWPRSRLGLLASCGPLETILDDNAKATLKAGDIVRLQTGAYAGERARVVCLRSDGIMVVLAKFLRPLLVEPTDCRVVHSARLGAGNANQTPSDVTAFRIR